MRWIWRIIWVILILPAAVLSKDYFVVFWDFADTANGLMMIPNIIAVSTSPGSNSVTKGLR
jgi:Na+/alanine symporter